MAYNLEQLRMLVETVETGSFSACARKLGKAQSAVSQGISNLEIDLDVELFDRQFRKATLSPEGKRLLPYAQSVLRHMDDLSAAAQSIHRAEESSIRIAVDDALLMPDFLCIIDRFKSAFPNTELNIATTVSPDIHQTVLETRADIGVLFSPVTPYPDVEVVFIGNLPITPVCSLEYPLAEFEQVRLNDLLEFTQIALRNSDGQGIDATPSMSKQIWSTSTFHLMKCLVERGLGWAYLPEHYVEEDIENGRLHKIPLAFEQKLWKPPVEKILPKNKVPGPALLWLSEQLNGLLP